MLNGRFRLAVIGIWDWWFFLGAALFTLSTWRSSRVGWAVLSKE
jgi:hypothetical protein